MPTFTDGCSGVRADCVLIGGLFGMTDRAAGRSLCIECACGKLMTLVRAAMIGDRRRNPYVACVYGAFALAYPGPQGEWGNAGESSVLGPRIIACARVEAWRVRLSGVGKFRKQIFRGRWAQLKGNGLETSVYAKGGSFKIIAPLGSRWCGSRFEGHGDPLVRNFRPG